MRNCLNFIKHSLISFPIIMSMPHTVEKECTLTVIILYDYDTDFSYTDRERLWKLICEWQDSLWYKQDME